MIKQNGQIALIIILVMTAALGVGLSIIQRSLTDITTSSKVEQSSRAFSAAEAGVERALNAPSGTTNFSVNSSNTNNVLRDASTDVAIVGNGPNDIIELKPKGKEEIAQFWFVDPKTLSTSSGNYTGSDFTLYFGNKNNMTDPPAIEVNVITRDSLNKYIANRYYFDATPNRPQPNGFDSGSVSCPGIGYSGITTTRSEGGSFLCRVTIAGYQTNGSPVLARIRILYSSAPQAIALAPKTGFPLPPNQVKIITSVGTSGETQRIVKVETKENEVPPLFDYALFSVTDIDKL
jgi:hypothetical protein